VKFRTVRRQRDKFAEVVRSSKRPCKELGSTRAKRASRVDEIVISVLWVTCVVEGAMAKVLPHVRDIAVSKLL
jgi:hypothetical protein